ncbi:MAG: hypothetical protein MPJ50_11885 [Pirellulales bacterium]|nr:hypothetical protein [Pirellulales bacterium]
MRSANRIAKYLKPSQRYSRSVHLERDFADTTALDQYIVTERIGQLFRQFATAFGDGSTERAWRITGDYGTGKSCFALALARVCGIGSGQVPKQLSSVSKGLSKADALPILVTGAREPISAAIIRALQTRLSDTTRRNKPTPLRDANRILRDADPAARDRFAIELLEATARYVSDTKQGQGVLLILDELGKSLEFATQNPDEQDITFLQSLAEAASRSGATPLVVLGILHQGFSAYADRMEVNDQREWDKIGGRFAELLFDQPLEQLVALVSNALGVKRDRLPDGVKRAAKANMTKAIDLGWFGAVANRKVLIEQAPAIYPLQPMLLPVLVKIFSRFGQNERSLFDFLCSSDVNSIRSFATEHYAGDGFFGIHHLYDYVRSSIRNRLHTRSLSSRWSQIQSVIDASLAGTDHEVAMLKTVGVLNMLDDQKLTATEESLRHALTNTCVSGRSSFSKTLESLRSKKHVLYSRGTPAGFWLWPYTSVNLELKYADAERAVRTVDNVVEAVAETLAQRPIVARRHYVETGNLRHFDLVYVKVSDFAATVRHWRPDHADGAVIVPLCQTKAEQAEAIETIKKLRLNNRQEILIAVPDPLSGLSGLVREIRRWEWIRKNVEELNGDEHGREEVSRQLAAATFVLLDRTNQVLDVRTFRTGQSIRWFHKGKSIRVASSKSLFQRISTICDLVFDESPMLRNELLNRRKLSSAAAAARMRLIERVLENATEEFLGMDASKKPPEMSMYLSALQQTNLHVKGRKGARIAIPTTAKDTCNLIPLFNRMRDVLAAKEGSRVAVSDLFAELRKPPIGARDGILPLMLSVFCVAEAQHVAMYEDGAFLHEIGGAEFARLVKVPESFELQYCKLSGVRSEVFNHLLKVVDSDVDESRDPDLIDVVKPLCQFAASLPDYSRNTTSLGKQTLAVRDALLNATEPATLLFEDLPAACGLPRIPVRKRSTSPDVKKYVRALKRSLGELRSAYPSLLSRIEEVVAEAFGENSNHEALRASLEAKSNDLSVHVTEPTLKAFCLRLADSQLPRDTWLESVGSLVVAKPPRRWHDRDEPRFVESLTDLVTRFERTASLAFSKSNNAAHTSLRISILQPTGVEEGRVVEVSDSKEAKALRKKVDRLFENDPNLAVSVTSQVLLDQLASRSQS